MEIPSIHGQRTFSQAFVRVTELHVVAKASKIEYVSMPS